METPQEPEKSTADLDLDAAHVAKETHEAKEPERPTTDLPTEEAHVAKKKSEKNAADFAADFQAKWLKDLKGDLTAKAESNDSKDLRRAQLTARANEKDRVEGEREERKEQKKQAKKDPKPKGRPRRVEGDEAPKKGRKSKKSTKEEEEAEKAAEPATKKTKTGSGNGEEAAAPKAKAKAKAAAKRTPRARGGKAPPASDKVMEKEMLDLLRRYKDVPYDKDKDVLHKIYTKKNSNPYCSIYFGRPAGGVKIIFPDGSETQKFYFSYAYSTVAVHIYCCNKIIAKFQNSEEGWWDSDEAMDLFQLLLITAGSAQKSFDAMDVD